MPNQPKTPHRTFRIPEDLYDAALKKAHEEGRTLTSVITELLREYITEHEGE